MPAPTPAEFLVELGRRGVSVSAEGERLRVRGPETERRPKVEAYLRRHKGDLIELLREQQQPEPHPSGLSDPFDGTEPTYPSAETLAAFPTQHEAYSMQAVSRLLCEARADNLPPYLVDLGDGRCTDDPSACALAALAACRAAKASGDTDAASRAASDLLELAAWWHGIEQSIGPSLYPPGHPDAPRINWGEPRRPDLKNENEEEGTEGG